MADDKTMVPTVLVGVGGTGHEVLSRIRRLVEEGYGDLRNFPLISFLAIDTDQEYKVTNPTAAGSPFKDNEKYWAAVTGKEVTNMISNMENYPWIQEWFPTELEKSISAIEAGAGQIRACGRFAFFCNYHKIQKAFKQACERVKAHENFMLDKHDIKVSTGNLNVFVVGSLSGGTGSGILLDLGYCIRNWLRVEGNPLITAVAPLPTAFGTIQVGDRVQANGYAALMELSYFSDLRTEYVAKFSSSLADEIRDQRAPFDFIYLVGTKNGEAEFSLDQLRELMAQNIFLDLTSDFASHKRSIRDNIKGAWAQNDPGGRGYPKNFMSFGLSTIEIPIAQIRISLFNRLAADLLGWWLNESVQLPAQLFELIQNDILKRMRLTEMELLMDLMAATDKSYLAEISGWVNGIRNQIGRDNLLQCTQQGILGVLRTETGKILNFVQGLSQQVEEYRRNHLQELSPDERLHGDFFRKMYDNRNQIVQRGREALDTEFYRIIEDRSRGPKFANDFIILVRQLLTSMAEKFRREGDQLWSRNEEMRRKHYEDALNAITHSQAQFGLTKQHDMEEYCKKALSGLEGSLMATLQRKARYLGLDVIARLEEHLDQIERQFVKFNQKLRQFRDEFQEKADASAKSADALVINGIKLYNRQELNDLYADMLEQYAAGAIEGNKSKYQLGLEGICTTVSNLILAEASPLWKENRQSDEIMRLFDIARLDDVNDKDFQEIIAEKMRQKVLESPKSSRLQRELAACDRMWKFFNNDESEIRNQLRFAYEKSKPIILLDSTVTGGKDAGFTPALNTKVAVVGGRNATDPAAQKLLPLLKERVEGSDSITPLGETERHRIVFVQEIGGFSLRCIDGMRDLRRSYQDWKGQSIEAKRAELRGENKEPPIPVHIQKQPPFWDIFPENPQIHQLVVKARALEILRIEENRSTNEQVVRYTRKGALVGETDNIDIASSWEEVVQVLDVLACREDKEEIERQVSAKLEEAETPQQKQQLSTQLRKYLQSRKQELEKEGGDDSLVYKREKTIISDVIVKYKLEQGNVGVEEMPTPVERVESTVTPPAPAPAPVSSAPVDRITPETTTVKEQLDFVFCTSCGTKNPTNSNFCCKCGTRLVEL